MQPVRTTFVGRDIYIEIAAKRIVNKRKYSIKHQAA